MSIAERVSQPLVSGERLSREEFLCRWEALPNLKMAELLEGVVYLPSPLGIAHGSQDSLANYWLTHYSVFTPGCETGSNVTWLMLEDAPQPDCFLRIQPEYGGQSGVERGLGKGAPELAVEVSHSSASYDLGPKFRLYRVAGVQEYITVLLTESKVIWRRLVSGAYNIIDPDADGLLRSIIFPGLWLDTDALLNQGTPRILEVLNQGLQSSEHHQFVQALAKRKTARP